MLQKLQFDHFGGLAADIIESNQKAQFEHFGGLAADMGKSCLRRPLRQVTSKPGFVHRRGVFEGPSDRRTSKQVTSKCGFVHRCGVLELWNLGFDDSCAVSSVRKSDLCTGAVFSSLEP